jgi:hypothetical protein
VDAALSLAPVVGSPARFTLAHADLLIVARDGERSRLGPKSVGRATRFVVDHAACPVLLVWLEAAPDVGTLPRRRITLITMAGEPLRVGRQPEVDDR